MKKKILNLLLFIFILTIVLFFLYFNNTNLVSTNTRVFYTDLKDSLRKKGYNTRLLVISTKRFKWHNDFQVKFSGAAKESRHLTGDAIDFIVFDINKDGKEDNKDIEIVYNILDKSIIKDKGGIGTYTGEKSFFDQQMIHIDSRGYKSRWAR